MADNLEVINCPACGKSMAKVYIESVKTHLDICLEGCGGILFDNQELEKFDEVFENIDEISTFYDEGEREYVPIDDKQQRKCPICGMIMNKYGNGTQDFSFEIDYCYGCGAKFLDAYELQKIHNVSPTEEKRREEFSQAFEQKYSKVFAEQDTRCKKARVKISLMRPFINWFANTSIDFFDESEFLKTFGDILEKKL